MEDYKIPLADIPTSEKYEGYLWWSDQQKPSVYQNVTVPDWPEETANPFIIEGNLINKHRNISYFIKFIDGQYLAYCFDLNKIPEGYKENCNKYLPNQMDGISKLCFSEYWKPEEDEFCEKMKVLRPFFIAFTGFI